MITHQNVSLRRVTQLAKHQQVPVTQPQIFITRLAEKAAMNNRHQLWREEKIPRGVHGSRPSQGSLQQLLNTNMTFGESSQLLWVSPGHASRQRDRLRKLALDQVAVIATGDPHQTAYAVGRLPGQKPCQLSSAKAEGLCRTHYRRRKPRGGPNRLKPMVSRDKFLRHFGYLFPI
jgi:hypothetical protein